MDTIRDEYEQAQVVKQWIRTYGPSIVGGVALGLLALFGWNAWQDYRHNRAASAAQLYAVLLDTVERDASEAQALARGVMADFSDTPYAFDAALVLARLQVEAGDLEAAETQLRWAMDNARPGELTHVARIRLARVLIAQGRSSDALALLKNRDPEGFASVYAELRGDILSKQGDRAGAREAYGRALELLIPGTGNRAVLQMKYDNLPAETGEPVPADETISD